MLKGDKIEPYSGIQLTGIMGISILILVPNWN